MKELFVFPSNHDENMLPEDGVHELVMVQKILESPVAAMLWRKKM